MRRSYLPLIIAMGAAYVFVSGPLATAQSAQKKTCAQQIADVQSSVSAIKDAKLKTQAEKAIAQARASADKKHERRCLWHLNAARKDIRRDTAKQEKMKK
ncbi:hypothetical protein [Oleiagrimonas sp. C23AA]|uniref:hypothetical protein n=1 Tax=Oleiagrimonas sp. C23AA TaxID=2719047 RepID=UPI0014204758|nr:hypothetical protein [Oleiagrimonas sp. C23AA]NII11078.1 hypothetical protein [Oleiagrimonas sp. C23AA]